MARRLVVQRQSDLDIQAAALWYEDQRPGLGMRFLSELDEVFQRIESNPKQFPQLEGEVRRARQMGQIQFGNAHHENNRNNAVQYCRIAATAL